MSFVSYKNKRVVITGCYSGMGYATAQLLLELGAEVHGIDYQPCTLPLASFTRTDLRDPQSIDSALSELKGNFYALFNCAGVPATFSPLDIFKVNYIGPRHLTDRLIPRIEKGGAICCIASSAGLAWSRNLATLKELLAISDYEQIVGWVEAALGKGGDAYSSSKEAIIAWTLLSSFSLIKQGVRMNCILPGPTQTPFMDKQSTITAGTIIDAFTQPIDRRSTPEEQAAALVFLNSEVASYINGVALPVDGGFIAGVTTGSIDLQKSFGKR